MKVSPESFIADEDLYLKYKSIFISGNDESYISSFLDLLLYNLSKSGYLRKDLNKGNEVSPDLFKADNGYVYVSNKYLGNKSVEEIEGDDDVFVFHEKTSAKNRQVKQFFANSKERALVECYELDQNKKKLLLNAFLKKHNFVLENKPYWFLLDILDNRFSILNQELENILLLDNKNDMNKLASILNLEGAVGANKFFFKIKNSRPKLISLLSSSINSLSDFYSYFSYFKSYSLLMLTSKNTSELSSKIPKYLFREKGELLFLFESLTENKKKLLSSLIQKTEDLVRKNPNLYKPLFFRFVINYKKIIS